MSKCRICARDTRTPFYRTNGRGEIVEGCVSKDHLSVAAGHFNKAYVQWYFREEAREIRNAGV